MPSQNYDDYQNDSSNFAQEGYGFFEFLQLKRKSEAEQEVEKAKLAGSTTETPEVNKNEQE